MGHRFVETTQNYAVANDQQVQADFYQACEKLDGWRLLWEATQMTDTLLQEQMQAGQENIDEVLQVPIAVPGRLSQFPAELARQLESISPTQGQPLAGGAGTSQFHQFLQPAWQVVGILW